MHMYEQLTFLEKIGYINESRIETYENYNDYACICFGCKCNTCANNVDCEHSIPSEEMKKPCFNCDECYYFSGDAYDRRNKQNACDGYRITEYAARRNREKLRIV